MSYRSNSIILFVVFFLLTSGLEAASYTAVKSGDWTDSATWGSGVPGLSDNAYINGGYTVNVNANASADIVYLANGASSNLNVATSGVTLYVGSEISVGYTRPATITHSAGTVNTHNLVLGHQDKYNSRGTYNLTGGAANPLITRGHIFVGKAGQGQLNMGDATNSGVIQMAPGKWFEIRDSVGTAWHNENSKVEGWGSVITPTPGTYYMQMMGKVIANGYGTDRSLDISAINNYNAGMMENYAYQTMVIDGSTYIKNTGTDGWYATNKGKLILKPVTAAAGTSKAWGEKDSDTIPDLINSIRIAFNSSVTGGNIDVSLLASDRSELSEVTGNILGVWDFQTAGNVLRRSAVDLTFRYDHALAAGLGLNETALSVYHLVNGSWVNLGGTVDAVNKLITVNGVDSFSMFAVGTDITSAPGTCNEILEQGLGFAGDLDRNCRVDYNDLFILLNDWLK